VLTRGDRSVILDTTHIQVLIKNPVGNLSRRPYMVRAFPPPTVVDYCAFCHPYKKPTHLWHFMDWWCPMFRLNGEWSMWRCLPGWCHKCCNWQVQTRPHAGCWLARSGARSGPQGVKARGPGDALERNSNDYIGESGGYIRTDTLNVARALVDPRAPNMRIYHTNRSFLTFIRKRSKRDSARSVRGLTCSSAILGRRVSGCSCVRRNSKAALDESQACHLGAMSTKRSTSVKQRIKGGVHAARNGNSPCAVAAWPRDGPRPRLKHVDIVQLFGERLIP